MSASLLVGIPSRRRTAIIGLTDLPLVCKQEDHMDSKKEQCKCTEHDANKHTNVAERSLAFTAIITNDLARTIHGFNHKLSQFKCSASYKNSERRKAMNMRWSVQSDEKERCINN
uniref:Uncharacterized protein n=1 Tax=Steinernema glaseri TaxID=37863 RepID=A0A1I7Z3V4_9BILA